MKSKLIGILLLSTIFMSMGVALAGADSVDFKVIVHFKGALEADDNLKAAMEDYSYVDWEVVLEDITASDLSGADMLIMIQADPAVEYTAAELSAVNSWMDTGHKTLWVCSDSDYPDGQELRIGPANDVLEAVDSKLRAENAEIEDSVSNFGAPYRVKGVSTNVAPEYNFLVAGVSYAQFHGCGIIIGYLNGNYYALDETDIDGIYVIMTSSAEGGIVVDVSEPAPEAHSPGQEGALATMVLEDAGNDNYILATSDAPFGHYSPMYKPEIQKEDRYGLTSLYPQQGAVLFGNILDMAVRNVMGGDITALETDVSGLEEDVSGLTGDVADLNAEVTSLGSEVSTLTSEKAVLAADVTAAQSSASTMQLAAVAALVIGVVVGYFVGPMIKKE